MFYNYFKDKPVYFLSFVENSEGLSNKRFRSCFTKFHFAWFKRKIYRYNWILFLGGKFSKIFLNDIKNTSNRVSYLRTIEPNTSVLFLIWQTGWVESASSDSGGTQQYLVKTDMIIVEVFDFKYRIVHSVKLKTWFNQMYSSAIVYRKLW